MSDEGRTYKLTLTVATPKGEDPRERNRLEDLLKANQWGYSMGYGETKVNLLRPGISREDAHLKLDTMADLVKAHGFTIWDKTLYGYPKDGLDVT